MAILVAVLVFAGVGGALYAVRRWFDRMPDAREHGTAEEELHHSEQITGAVIQSGTGGFNGR